MSLGMGNTKILLLARMQVNSYPQSYIPITKGIYLSINEAFFLFLKTHRMAST